MFVNYEKKIDLKKQIFSPPKSSPKGEDLGNRYFASAQYDSEVILS